jgi:hypothetical protein
MTTDMTALLEHGAACVRVARNDKRPLGNAWQTLATSIADVIDGWLDDGYNVGLLLGHGSLIDVEYDDEDGRQLLESSGLLGIRTPTWASGRGEHRLFRLADPVPPMGWRKIGGAEIRIGGKPAQSVLPPSVHRSGRRYEWLISPADCSPAVVSLADLGITG